MFTERNPPLRYALLKDFLCVQSVIQILYLKITTQAQLLSLYANFKQATEGDVKGKQPSRVHFRARAKFDAWAKLKGQSAEAGRKGYLKTANEMLGRAKL